LTLFQCPELRTNEVLFLVSEPANLAWLTSSLKLTKELRGCMVPSLLVREISSVSIQNGLSLGRRTLYTYRHNLNKQFCGPQYDGGKDWNAPSKCQKERGEKEYGSNPENVQLAVADAQKNNRNQPEEKALNSRGYWEGFSLQAVCTNTECPRNRKKYNDAPDCPSKDV
jgi:hypothetical protein